MERKLFVFSILSAEGRLDRAWPRRCGARDKTALWSVVHNTSELFLDEDSVLLRLRLSSASSWYSHPSREESGERGFALVGRRLRMF